MEISKAVFSFSFFDCLLRILAFPTIVEIPALQAASRVFSGHDFIAALYLWYGPEGSNNAKKNVGGSALYKTL